MLVSEKYKLSWDNDGYESPLSNFLISKLEFYDGIGTTETKRFLLMINPYQKVLDLYMNQVLPNHTPIYKDKMKFYIQRFKNWVGKMFLCEKLIVDLKFKNTAEIYSKILQKYRLNNLNYDLVIRDFEFKSDLYKLDENIDIDYDLDYKWKITQFYDFETAKIIFSFYKSEFYFGNYDPFSFSEKDLTKDEKIDFLHKPF